MVRVTIELVPIGIESLKRHLYTVIIANDGSGTLTNGNYDVFLSYKGKPTKVRKKVRVEGFPRTKLAAYHLTLKALQALTEKKK